jgi:hypothetical protein
LWLNEIGKLLSATPSFSQNELTLPVIKPFNLK